MKRSIDISEFRPLLIAEKEHCTYDELQEKYGVNRYYLWQIIHTEGYQVTPKVAQKLGITTFAPAPVCPECGIVHTKRCPRKRLDRRPWRDRSDQEIRLAYLFREVIK